MPWTADARFAVDILNVASAKWPAGMIAHGIEAMQFALMAEHCDVAAFVAEREVKP